MVNASRNLRLQTLTDPYRPAYHFVVPEGYAVPADPNGAIYWNGRYHLGYIYQNHGVHYWGHVSSLDLLHWRHHPPSLYPTPDSPETGIFSGNCFINKQGEATMLYHGCDVGNCIATSGDAQLDTWTKLSSNPIVPVAEDEKGRHLGKERLFASWDPHGWLENDTYYAIFGGKRPAVFRAAELDKWEYVGDLFAHAVEGVDINEDVSCPDFFRLGDKWVLLCISHKLGCRYYVGEWKDEQFYPKFHERMSWADRTLFAPESLQGPQGRRIMWAWALDQPTLGRVRRTGGWSGTFSLPRELWLGEDNHLRMRPVQELEQLHHNERRWASTLIKPDTETVLNGVQGQLLDIELELQLFGTGRCGVKVCCSPDGEEETLIGYDAIEQKLIIDTRRSGHMGVQGIEGGPLSLSDNETLRLRVLVDKSVVEAFANDRQGVLRRIYPSRSDSVGVKLFAEGSAARVRSVTIWNMMPSNPH